jgi:hypothetical protein
VERGITSFAGGVWPVRNRRGSGTLGKELDPARIRSHDARIDVYLMNSYHLELAFGVISK